MCRVLQLLNDKLSARKSFYRPFSWIAMQNNNASFSSYSRFAYAIVHVAFSEQCIAKLVHGVLLLLSILYLVVSLARSALKR